MKLKPREKVTSIDNGLERLKLIPIENQIPLEALIRFELRDRKTAAYLLRKQGTKGESLQFVFGFETKGVHTTLQSEQVENIFDAIENGLKDLPAHETLTVHFGSFSSDGSTQQRLSELALSCDSPPLQFLLLGEKQRISELTQSGLRKPKFLRFYCTYSVDPETANAADWIERSLAKLEAVWGKVSGSAPISHSLHYEEVFERAFIDGFIRWEQLLSTKMNLLLAPMDEDSLWAALWSRFNRGPAPPLPQVMVYGAEGIEEQSASDIHLTTHLFPTQQSVPFADRSFVFARDQYVAAMPFVDKPAGWASKEQELRYFWDIFARDAVYDTECFCQITRANEALIKENMSRVTRQAISAQTLSAEHNAVDVGASIRQNKAVDAQAALYEGALPLQVGVVFLVHRATPEKLDSACRYLQNCFRRPAWIEREMEYAWRIWLQTLPTTWERLLAKPFDRRLIYLNGEVPAFMSLVQPCPVDREGLELISDEGGVPIHIDLYGQHRNILLLATTRGGKSAAVADMVKQGLARGIPAIIMDFPPSDAASTFKDFTHHLGGAYFDIGREANNLFELPDLSTFSVQEREERLGDYKEFLASALMIMVFGSGVPQTTADRMLKQAIRSVILPAVDAFFRDEHIQARYAAAQRQGLGSEAWAQMPTLVDFLSFFEVQGLAGLSQSVLEDAGTQQAINLIARQLRFWVESRVGRAIARPSTFDTDAQLLVFALRGLSDGDDAAVLALAAYSAALRRTLSYPESIFFLDEFSVLLEWEEIGQLVARLTANGAKAGIRVLLAAQDPNTLANCKAGPKIIQNISTRLIGRIQPVAQDSFVEILKLAPDVIARNASKTFYPSKEGLYSQWLLDESATQTFVRYYSPPLLLAVVANNPNETAARKAFLDYYGDPYQGLVAFSQELAASLRESRPFRIPVKDESTLSDSALPSGDVLAS